MKQKLLLLFASAMMGVSASAVEWELPIPEKQTSITYGDTVYLYNRDAKAFFLGANYYETHGSVGPKGYKCVLEKTDEGFITIKDSVETKGAMYYVMCENGHECYVDYANNGVITWTFEDKGEGNYYIFTTCPERAGLPLGVTSSNENKTILDFTNDDPTIMAENWITWNIISQASYNKYMESYSIYAGALSLKSKIDEATGLGLDASKISAAEAVYNNTSATLAEMDKANEDIQEAINYYKETSITPENPKDLTEQYIPDADFELNQGAGVWQRTHAAQNYQTSGTAGKLGDATVFLEAWNGSAFKGKQYVKITGLPNGVYQFFLSAATNGGNGSYVYAGNDSVEVTSGEMTEYFVFTRVTDGTLEVGFNMPNAIQNWIGIDDAKLLYLGNTAPSYAYWVSKFLEKAPKVDDETFAQKSLQDSYSALLNTDLNKFTTVEEILNFNEQFTNTLADFNANVAAYAEFKKCLDQIDELQTAGYEGESADELYDSYEDGEIYNIKNNMTLSTEEMIAKTAEVASQIDDVKKHCLAKDMVCTNLLVNPNFNDRLTGWSHDTKLADVAWGGLSSNPDVEKWNANFDFYQVVEGIPNGVYELTVQAFYRPTGDTKGSYENYISEDSKDEILAFIYANTSETAILNIGAHTYSENLDNNCSLVAEGLYCPNGMNSASIAFAKGDYVNVVKGVVTDGVLKVGIKSTNGTAEGRWTLWDNFQLKYLGKDYDAIMGVIGGYAEEVDKYIADDALLSKGVKKQLNEKNNVAQDAKTGDDAFAALNDLIAALNDAKQCVEDYKTLTESINRLSTDVDKAVTPDKSLTTSASALYSEVETAINNGTIEPADIEAKITEIKQMGAKLRIPAYEGASETNKINFTSTILNPSFENENGEADSYGWVDEGEIYTQNQTNSDFDKVGSVYHERWHVSGTINLSQTIICLPAGYYVLTVGSAHCDTGDAFVYANANQTEIKGTAPHATARVSVVGQVGEDGILKIGAKCTLTGSTWFCVDDFSLEYLGTEAPTEIDETDEIPLFTTTVYSVSGTLVNGLQKGINIVKMSDGSVKKVIVK